MTSNTALGWVAALGVALVAALGFATALVFRAQREIDRRTAALASAREALAPFMSRSTRERAANGPTTARRRTITVLFLDICDFSTFADTSTPEDAAALVSKVASVAFGAVLRFDGDVDRLIGDGLIARFDGTDRQVRAWQAAQHVMADLAEISLPREVSIALHDGVVIDAQIGGKARADATILGRTVNISSRLCGEAAPGELVVSDTMLPMPEDLALRPKAMDIVHLKGHRHSVAIHRFRHEPKRRGASAKPPARRDPTSPKSIAPDQRAPVVVDD